MMKRLEPLTRRWIVAFATIVLCATMLPGVNQTAAPIDPAVVSGGYALVRVAHGAAESVAAEARAAGASDVAALDALDMVTAQVTTDALRAIRFDARVKFVGADLIVTASDKDGEFEKDDGKDKTNGKVSAGIAAIGAPDAWRKATGKCITVALMDTGVARHPDLEGSVVARLDFVKDGTTSLDPGGHGTFMAGLIAAHGKTFSGVAPDAKIVSLRVLDAKGTGTLHSVLGAFDWLLHNRAAYGIRVLNLSFGAPQAASYHRELLAGVVESAHFAGVVVIAAAGNDGPKPGTVSLPAADPFVVAVGSFDDKGKADKDNFRESKFSGRGPTLDGFVKPDVLAPGEHVRSLRVPGTMLDRAAKPGDTNAYAKLTGTSASSAMVAGVAALVLQAHRSYTPTQVKGAITAGGVRIDNSKTRVADAAKSIDARPAPANVGVLPSKLLMALLQHSGQLLADGVSWEGISWEGISWESVSWEGVSWDSVSWESVTWESVTWESVTWEAVSWDALR